MSGKKTEASDKSAVKTVSASKPAAEKTAAKTVSESKPAAVKTVGASKPAAEKTAVKTVSASKPAAERTAVKTVSEPKPAAEKTAAKTVSEPKPAAEKTAAEAIKEAIAESFAAKKPEQYPSKIVNSHSVKTAEEKHKEIKTVPQKTSESKTSVKSAPRKKRILFVASEVQPFAGTGGLGEVMGSVGKTIAALRSDYDVRVVVPLYEAVTKETREKLKYLKHINVQLSWRSQYCGIFECVQDGVTYYFVDNEYYYKRPNLYGYYDDGERFAFFSKAALDILPEVGFCPDIIHTNDWQTALVPIYYKLYYMHREWFKNIKTVFTIHNIEYQGKYGRSIIEDVFGIAYREYPSIEHGGCINLMKGAIDYADCITTVSPSYAQEILTDFYGHGLQKILIKNSHKLRGILNGIDVGVYNPETDTSMFSNFNVKTVDTEKVKNKTELQAMINLPINKKVPMIAVISRLVGHKGLDLIKHVMHEIIAEDIQLVILGKGDADYENYFSYMQGQYPNKVCSIIAYNKDLSHKIYASSDFFLMPSRSEPCGLSQMIASRYGTIPIVRETGGLKDSIIDAYDGKFGNGYTFGTYNAHDMLNCIKRAIGLYKDYPDIFKELRARVMEKDFSWTKSAYEYLKMYDWLIDA